MVNGNGIIIGIVGVKNSGKDTVASMIKYIFDVGIHRAKYVDWFTNYYNKSNKVVIIHFADGLKKFISVAYGIPRKYLDNRDYKDNKFFCLDDYEFYDVPVFVTGKKLNIINNESLKLGTLNRNIKKNCCNYIKLRTLMQYIGTDVCRKHLDEDIWVKGTIKNAILHAYQQGVCVIADIRFKNEADAIRECLNNDQSLYGRLIKVSRDEVQTSDKIEHVSEDNKDIECDYVIDNNGSINKLFIEVSKLCQDIIQKTIF